MGSTLSSDNSKRGASIPVPDADPDTNPLCPGPPNFSAILDALDRIDPLAGEGRGVRVGARAAGRAESADVHFPPHVLKAGWLGAMGSAGAR